MAMFNTGNLFEKTAYMFNPVRFDYLEKPSVTLSLEYL